MKYIEYINKQNALNYLCDIAYKRGLSVNTLVNGIADKGNVSRMRNGKAKITLDIVMLLANRLDVNLEEALRNSSPTNPDFFEAIDSIQYYTRIHDYEASQYLTQKVEKEFSEDILKSIEIAQIIGWSKAVIQIEIVNDYHYAIDILNKTLNINNKSFNIQTFTPDDYTDIEIGIINSILICHFNISGATLEIKDAYKKLKEYIDYRKINDYETSFDIYYEYLITCIKLGTDREQLLSLAEDTAQIALENGLTNKLPFIYYQIANIYLALNDYSNAKEHLNSTLFLFKQINAPEHLISTVESVIKKYFGEESII